MKRIPFVESTSKEILFMAWYGYMCEGGGGEGASRALIATIFI